MVKVFIFAWFAVAFAKGSSDGQSDFDVLQNLMDNGKRNVLETFGKIKTTSEEFDEFFIERMNSLLWECTVQQQTFNKSITDAVTTGMSKDKRFTNFQCISNAARDAFKKLVEVKSQTQVKSQSIYEKTLKEITQFKVTFVGFFGYIQELHKSKKEELEKAQNEGARKRILDEAIKKIKLLGSILEQIISNAKAAKFKFMEEYINFASSTEKNLKKTQKEETTKMMKCIS